MLTSKQRLSVVLVFIFTNLFLNTAAYLPFKILSEEVDIIIGVLLISFNLFMSRNIAYDYINIIIKSNMRENRIRSGGKPNEYS